LSELPGRGPKYLRIADALRAQIESGELSPGDRLPSEASLLRRFGVSLPTLRQATGQLRAEGLLEARQGIGTFVKADRRRERRSRARYGRARGDEQLLTSALRHAIVSAGRESVHGRIAEAMGVEEGTDAVVRRRHLRDPESNELAEIGASYLPVDFAFGTYLMKEEVVPKALFLCVEDLIGKTYAQARDEWLARPATAWETELFDFAVGTPVVHVLHTARAGDGTVLEVSESVWPADRIIFVDEYEIPSEAEPPNVASSI